MDTQNRRTFLKRIAQGGVALSLGSVGGNIFPAPHIKNSKISDKVFVLGIDGMDPDLLTNFIARGGMPTFEKFITNNSFHSLQTTLPPQSPVAWSSFITGCNPGVHGIFDFIHRDPKTFEPYLSTTRTYEADKSITLGNWTIPLGKGRVELMRSGRAFWNLLEDKSIPATLYKLPANFPVQEGSSRMLSGMSTPDVLGSYGTFTYFTDLEVSDADKFTGGRVVKVDIHDHRIDSRLEGPPNSLRRDRLPVSIPFTVYRDPWKAVAKITIQNSEIILKQGEWSEWIPLTFELLPHFAAVNGMVRLYMQQIHPHFRLYMSPINIDPADTQIPISNPDHYSRELSEAVGRFYTQGFPEDTKALSHNIFSNEEFLQQSKYVLEERQKAFDYELNRFDEGLFFFYFSSLDQNSHMMLRTMDPSHPLYEPDAHQDVKDAVYYFYKKMDTVLKQTLSKMDSHSSLFILSDHGFSPFTREFHLSTWLVENGFTSVTNGDKKHESRFYDYVDWSTTKAFAMGLNSIYINVKDREKYGSVAPDTKEAVKAELIARLNDVRDPISGRKVLVKAYDANEIYHGRSLLNAPDIVLGYQKSYRISDEAALGGFPEGSFGDRMDKWSADHCMDPSVVPGVFLSNHESKIQHPAIWDVAPTIIKAFGLEPPTDMDGRSLI